MNPLIAHIILHVGLCSAIAHAPPDTTVAMRVRLIDKSQITRFEQTFRFERGYDDAKVVEFDAPSGEFRLDLQAPRYRCTSSSYQEILAGHGRSITQTLAEAPVAPEVPVLLEGAAPPSFLYVKPEFVLLPKNAECNKPVGDLLPSRVEFENDQDAFYVWLYQSAQPNPATLALRLRTPTHQYHYIRLPIPYPLPTGRWPSNIQFDVTEDEIAGLATQPTDVLLCLHLWQTKVYY